MEQNIIQPTSFNIKNTRFDPNSIEDCVQKFETLVVYRYPTEIYADPVFPRMSRTSSYDQLCFDLDTDHAIELVVENIFGQRFPIKTNVCATSPSVCLAPKKAGLLLSKPSNFHCFYLPDDFIRDNDFNLVEYQLTIMRMEKI